MKEVKIKDLKPGDAAQCDYFDRDGKILIKQGAVINETLLNAITRRNITRFYIQEEGEDIKKLLSIKVPDLEDLDFEESEAGAESDAAPPVEKIVIPVLPIEKVLPSLGAIKKGEEGIRQILETRAVKSVDEALEKEKIPLSVAPVGAAIDSFAREMKPDERTVAYKKETVGTYENAVNETKNLLLSIRNGTLFDGGRIVNLVKTFVRTFLNDKHMLLNLANGRTQEQDYLFAHSVNVTLIAISIGASRGFDKDQILEIGVGALLHDAGAMLIPGEIRFKAEPLTKDEQYEIQKHPMLGIHLIEKIKSLPAAVPYICYQSHERENRQGYPKQRNGRLIHDYAKIVAVADVYDSLTSPRPYRAAVIPYKAMESILRSVKEGYFNSDTAKYYLEYTSLFPVGSLVRLSTNEIAKVVRPNRTHYSRPVVSVIIGADNALLREDQIRTVDLLASKDKAIVQAVDNSKLNIGIMHGF